jgi:excisionase family DNA binding protein
MNHPPPDIGGQRRPATATRLLGGAHHDWPDVPTSRSHRANDGRRNGERSAPSKPGGPREDQRGELVTHLALGLTRYIRHLRQTGHSVPPALDDVAALLVRCVRTRPATTQVDDEQPAEHDGAMAGRLLVTKAEAAEYLHVSVRTVERLIAAGHLPLLHIERASRLRLADIEAYVESLIADKATQPLESDEPTGYRA